MALAPAMAACDVEIPPENARARGSDRPPLQLGVVSATGSYGDGGGERVTLSETSIAEGLEVSASFRLFFDRYLLPTTAIRQAVCLHPSATPIASIDACVEPFQPFAAPEYNPVKRELVVRLAPGTRLSADTLYRLTVFPPRDEDSTGLRAFDGAPLVRSYAFDFKTKADTSTARDELGPSAEAYCAAQKCLRSCADATDVETCRNGCRPLCLDDACQGDGDVLAGFVPEVFGSCAYSPCHAAAPGVPAPMGLDLSRKSLISATAIGVVAHGTATGEASFAPEPSGPKFGRAMALIAPDDPGQSYLLYKLIANPLNHPREPGALEPQHQAELDRLCASVVVGLPMPAENGEHRGLVGGSDKDGNPIDPDGSKSFAALQLISDWIAHGAVVECPAD